MSTSSAKTYARRAESATDTNEKLDGIAKALYALATALEDIERTVKQIKSRQ